MSANGVTVQAGRIARTTIKKGKSHEAKELTRQQEEKTYISIRAIAKTPKKN